MEESTKNEKEILEERRKKVFDFFKKSEIWVYVALVLLIILGMYIRSLPMTDHGGNPGLWDVTTNSWTLGPDLDPWLFMRQAKNVIETGTYPKMDLMRNVPLGFDNSKETMLLPYMIDWTYHVTKIFKTDVTPLYAGVIFPVIMFVLTIISFFFFVREIFTGEEKEKKLKANIIAVISTLIMIVIPVFLSRTIAGIPEKESAGFFFMFLSYYLFIKAFRGKNVLLASIFGALAGLSTMLMALIWGGVMFVYISIAIVTFIAFILNKIHRKEITSYALWLFVSIAGTLIFSNRESITSLLTSLSSGLAFVVLLIILIDVIIWRLKFFSLKLEKIKLPKKIISLIFAIVVIVLLAFIILGPNFIVQKIKAVHQATFHPVVGRWNTTVAENRQPSFMEWASSFGPTLKNIPMMFALFFLGSILFVYRMLHHFSHKEKIAISFGYGILLVSMVFSRYSDGSILNGENALSKFIYYAGVLIFLVIVMSFYFKDSKSERKNFNEIEFNFLFLLVLLLLGIFSARGAVRVIMVLAPIAAIFVGYFLVESISSFFRSEKNKRVFWGVISAILILSTIFIIMTFYREAKSASYSMVPSMYNQQWQKAMDWVRNETPKDSVFGHWWDYGYWVQSIGERATITDGGNAITFWNYWMGRLVLTGNNQKDALEFLYNHNATYFLIDSSDIGKYGAFSSIGSDENYDRYSWTSAFILDQSQIQETNGKITYVYGNVVPLDEDLTITENGQEIFLPSGQTMIIGGVVSLTNNQSVSVVAEQPFVVAAYGNKQYKIKVRYLKIGEEFVDFKNGVEGTVYLFPSIVASHQGNQISNLGAMMYLSPRLMRGMLAQKYILNDPFNNFKNFEVAHIESSPVVSILRSQEVSVPEFVYYQGIQGPIIIWKIKYTGNEKLKQEYIDRDPSKYLSWQL